MLNVLKRVYNVICLLYYENKYKKKNALIVTVLNVSI